MTGREDLPEEADVSAETEQQVRALLAESAVTEPTPPAVAARLDDALAGLVAERGRPTAARTGADGPDNADGADGSVVGATELGSRRPRLWPRLLVAAAAVSVLGLGIGNLDDLTGAGAGDAATTDSAAGSAAEDRAAPEASVLSGKAEPESGGTGPESLSEEAAPGRSDGDAATEPGEGRVQAEPYPSLATAPRLSSSSATLDLQRIEDFALAVPVGDSPAAWARMCVQPVTAPGDEWLPVHLDGEPGVLLLRASAGGRRTAEIFTCEDAGSPALSTEVRAAR